MWIRLMSKKREKTQIITKSCENWAIIDPADIKRIIGGN